jgi:flagellar M-ring protein FliF
MAGMMDGFRNALARLAPRQRIQLGLGVVALVGVVWGLSVYASRIRYGVLFSNLRGDDAGPVIAALKDKQIPYRLGASGTVVEVPAEKVDEVRLELAGEGLPRGGGVGFEIFDKPSFGLSDFVQNVNYRRALERELARTIQGLDVVESARVHLALPPASVFADERKEASASVVVRLRARRALSNNQVRAISHLVASGVDGLDPSRVSVIDGEGRMLSEGGGAESAEALSASQIESKRSLELGLETTLVSILEPVVGGGRVRARATVELDMARVQRVEETYDPDVAVVRSEQKSKTRRQSGAGGGIPGTASNLPTGTPVAAAGTSGADESQSSTTNFEINKTVATIAEPVGKLSRQSVAVVVDNAVTETPGADGKTERKSVPRTEGEMKKITDLVRAAAGINETRGDVLIVENIAFDGTAGPAADLKTEGGDRWGFWLQVARYAALPIAVLLVVLLAVRPAIAALRAVGAPVVGAGTAPPTIAELQASLASGALPAAGAASGELRRKLIEAAGQHPEAAAFVVRGWLAGRKGE